jgi:hypothetical protein
MISSSQNQTKGRKIMIAATEEISPEDIEAGATVRVGNTYPGGSWRAPFWGKVVENVETEDFEPRHLVVRKGKDTHKVPYNSIIEWDPEGKRHQTPEQQLKSMEDFADMVIEGAAPSLLILGRAGLGKTFRINQRIKAAGLEKGEDYKFVKGRSTPMGLYKVLYEHRDELIVFDDCDSVLKIKEGFDILKAALDSYDEREISYVSSSVTAQGMEQSFLFTGRIIFISNVDGEDVDGAIRNRGYCVDISMSNLDVARLMEAALPFVEPDVDLGSKLEVLDFMKEVSEEMEDFSFRTLLRGIQLHERFEDWEDRIFFYA